MTYFPGWPKHVAIYRVFDCLTSPQTESPLFVEDKEVQRFCRPTPASIFPTSLKT